MEDLDLQIENYNLKDLLNLFHLKHNFDKKDLKKAKEMALKTHPDKSRLDKEVFLFFLKAYKRIENIYNFRIKKEQDIYNAEYTSDLGNITSESDKLLLKKLHGKSVRDFNKWFNEMFEKTKIRDKENETGYGEWFKEEMEDVGTVKSLNDFGKFFNKKKTQQKALIKHSDVNGLNGDSGGYNLNRENTVEQYSSHIFSKLQYEDLKKAHTETVVPVTEEDFINKEKYRNIDELNRARENQDVSAMSLKSSKKILENRKIKDDELAAITAFNLLKQQEEVEKSNKEWWMHLKQLNN
ncbi:MAG: hypothetical protein CBC84_002280 [Pelagibacteraceae bacterium TMED124]|nr:MAG: hypothetical protein CBC84_002280 [Pelagibacteraceae bacterium TMED124]|tara:strand:+ start:14986 stop:15873 length:888 start_codon:yes stop_codon:yes gene_type:complete